MLDENGIDTFFLEKPRVWEDLLLWDQHIGTSTDWKHCGIGGSTLKLRFHLHTTQETKSLLKASGMNVKNL